MHFCILSIKKHTVKLAKQCAKADYYQLVKTHPYIVGCSIFTKAGLLTKKHCLFPFPNIIIHSVALNRPFITVTRSCWTFTNFPINPYGTFAVINISQIATNCSSFLLFFNSILLSFGFLPNVSNFFDIFCFFYYNRYHFTAIH